MRYCSTAQGRLRHHRSKHFTSTSGDHKPCVLPCLTWDERWTLNNLHGPDWESRLTAIVFDFWAWVAAALTRR